MGRREEGLPPSRAPGITLVAGLVAAALAGGAAALSRQEAAILLTLAVLAVGIVATCVVIAFVARSEGRRLWWAYLAVAIVSPINLFAIIAWFARLARNPVLRDGKPAL